MAIKDVITLGLGCSPGSIKYLLTLGLDIGAAAATVIDLTLPDRTLDLTLRPRSLDLTLRARSVDLTLEPR